MPAPDERPEQDYAEAFFSLRAPRVAIVFPADTPHWDFFARKALWRANQLWGGAGFVLVPHNAGDVSDNVLRGVAAYDPDYVVGHQVSWKELLTAYPKARDMFVDEHGAKIDFQTLSLNDSAETAPAADPNTERARRTVADACQVYRRRHEPEASPTCRCAGTRLGRSLMSPIRSSMTVSTSRQRLRSAPRARTCTWRHRRTLPVNGGLGVPPSSAS